MSTNKNTITTGGGIAELSFYGTSAPTSTAGHNAGDTFYVTPLGTQADSVNSTAQYRFDGSKWVKTPGGSTIDIKPSLSPVLDILTTPPSSPNDQDSYIVKATATGTWLGKEGDIATWDAVNNTWEFKSPSDGNKTTVTTGDNAGIWQYASTSDSWVQVQSGISIPTPSLSVAAGNIKLPSISSMLSGQGTGTPIGVIQNRSIWIWGDTGQITPGDRTSGNSVPRQVSVSYNNLVDGSYTKGATSYPEFVDFCWNDVMALAIDSNGKVWAGGGQVQGSGLTTTPTGTTAVTNAPLYALHPVTFFGTITDKVAKVYMPLHTPSGIHSMVITQAGVGYVTGLNSNGQLGLGDTTARANWVQYPITNLKYAILGQGYTIVVRANGDVYFSGSDSGGFTGAAGNKTTPVLVTTGAATYEKSVAVSSQASATTIWVVKANGTFFAGGANANGQQGRGNTTAVTGCTQVTGITNAKFVSPSSLTSESVALVRTDNTISFAGLNRSGKFGYSPNASAVNNTTFVTPSATWQGLVADVIHGYNTTAIRTADGFVYTAGDANWTGTGRGAGTNWVDNNKFKEIAFPNQIVGMFGIQQASNNNEGFVVLTNIGSIYGFGSALTTRYTNANSIMYSPARIPMWGDTGVTTLSNLPLASDSVGNITAATSSTVTDIVDGVNGQTVTFTVNYTGGTFGTINLTGSTVTGVDITQVSLSTTSAIITDPSGSFTISFVINAADITALVPPNTQPQSYVLNLLINGV